MFAAAPPPPDPPAIFVETQQRDFDCLRVATMLGKSSNNAGISPWAPRLFRIYLGRLQQADPARDWIAASREQPQEGSGWFLSHLQACTAPLRGSRPIRPTQAAPPLTPAPVTPAPTGG